MESKFKTFDHVLVRDCKNEAWRPAIFARESNVKDPIFKYVAMLIDYDDDPESSAWNAFHYCIPFEGNENLQGTNQEQNESSENVLEFIKNMKRGHYYTLTSRNGVRYNIIFSEIKDNEIYSSALHERTKLYDSDIFTKLKLIQPDQVEFARESTDVEINFLNDQMKFVGKRYNPEKDCVELIRWKPEVGELYFTIQMHRSVFDIFQEKWDGDEYDNASFNNGNCYQLRSDAEKKLEEFKRIKF